MMCLREIEVLPSLDIAKLIVIGGKRKPGSWRDVISSRLCEQAAGENGGGFTL